MSVSASSIESGSQLYNSSLLQIWIYQHRAPDI